MEKKSSIASIYINLPIQDVGRARAFWTKLGFGFNEKFSDDKALCLILKEDNIYAMLIANDYFKTFTNRPVADGSSTQVLLAIDVGSREQVDEVVRIALENGATRYLEPSDYGWMYYDRFQDPDGHQWEIMHADEKLIPKE
jgi:uncharacterized protein